MPFIDMNNGFRHFKKPDVVIGLVFFLLVVFISFSLRFRGVEYGFPLLLHSDEPAVVDRAIEIGKTGNLNPEFFQYPSGYIYAQAAVYRIVYLCKSLCGFDGSFADAPRLDFYYWGRVITVLFSVLTLIFVYLTGSRIGNRWTGLFAMTIAGFSVLHVKKSYFIAVDVPMAFGVVTALYYSTLIFGGSRKLSHYLLSSLAIGFAAGTKYNGAVSVVYLLGAHLISSCNLKKSARHIYLVFAGFMALTSFAVTTPYSILDHQHFLKDLFFEVAHYNDGHIGFSNTGNSYLAYWKDIYSGIGSLNVYLAAVSAVVLIAGKRHLIALFILLFPVVYYLLVGRFKVHFDRNIVPVIPCLAVLSSIVPGLAISYLQKNLGRLKEGINSFGLKRGCLLLVSVSVLVVFFYGAHQQFLTTSKYLESAMRPDTRVISTKWINDNLKEGSRLAMDYYTPRPNESKFRIGMWGICGLGKQTRDFSKFDYIVTSSTDYGRYYKNKGKYKKEYQRYKNIFENNLNIKTFKPIKGVSTGPRINILKVGK